MIKFEVPFNFYKDFVEKVSERRDLFDYIDCFYVAAWKEDCDNTRQGLTFANDYPATYEEYVERIQELQTLGIRICILAQKNASLEMIERYIALGIDAFTINDDVLAKAIKEKYSDVRLTLSVTRALSLQALINGDFSMYDRIVLFHWFARHLNAMERLPKKYQYVMICNSKCHYDCKWHDAHWFIKANSLCEYSDREQEVCKTCYSIMGNDARKTSIIEPENLDLFDPYVSAYKLTDRGDFTEHIIDNLNAYATRTRGCIKDREYYNIDENEAAQ